MDHDPIVLNVLGQLPRLALGFMGKFSPNAPPLHAPKGLLLQLGRCGGNALTEQTGGFQVAR
jgi:hypothetical protein